MYIYIYLFIYIYIYVCTYACYTFVVDDPGKRFCSHKFPTGFPIRLPWFSPEDFAVKLPRKLIDDLKATAGGIAATWWILAVAEEGK